MIREEFAVHMLNEKGRAKAERLAHSFSELLEEIEGLSGKEGREIALVRTHLQLASFYAKRAMAQRPENQA